MGWSWGDLAVLGYQVAVAVESYEDGFTRVPAVYRVRGFGADVLLRADDLEGFIEAHDSRIAGRPGDPVVSEPQPSTIERVVAALDALPDGHVTKADLLSALAEV